ncbi:MAG: magnesium transporter CorA family protein [Treponemataceae bacterium]
MITFWQQENGKLIKQDEANINKKERLWVDAREVTREDIRILEDTYAIQSQHILDILDQDELSRVEKVDTYTLIILRLPLFVSTNDISYLTIPLGIIFFPDVIVTICWTDCEVLHDMSSNRFRSVTLNDFTSFTIQIMSRSDSIFLKYLKEINRRSIIIQKELEASVKNNELIQLLNLEKSLVFFTPSLKSNQLLLEKLMKSRVLVLDEEDREWLEDVEVDNRQAIEMAETYSDILAGMMDAFASVISNNLNIIMKKLTVISLVLMVPTFIVGLFGMNVPLPFENSNMGLFFILLMCGFSSCIAFFLLKDKPVRVKRERSKLFFFKKKPKGDS